jgi:hypothetical protein
MSVIFHLFSLSIWNGVLQLGTELTDIGGFFGFVIWDFHSKGRSTSATPCYIQSWLLYYYSFNLSKIHLCVLVGCNLILSWHFRFLVLCRSRLLLLSWCRFVYAGCWPFIQWDSFSCNMSRAGSACYEWFSCVYNGLFWRFDVSAGLEVDGWLKYGSELRGTVAKSNNSLLTSLDEEGNSGRATR